MSKRGRRRERPQKSMAETTMEQLLAKWDLKEISMEDCFDDLKHFFFAHITKMQMFIYKDGSAAFRFRGDGNNAILYMSEGDKAKVGYATCSYLSQFDDIEQSVIDASFIRADARQGEW